jgi:hypothetical protein
MRFFSYKDPEQTTQEQIDKVRSHPWIAKDVPVRGFIFDGDRFRYNAVSFRVRKPSVFDGRLEWAASDPALRAPPD